MTQRLWGLTRAAMPPRWVSAVLVLAGTAAILVLHAAGSPVHLPGDFHAAAHPAVLVGAALAVADHVRRLTCLELAAWQDLVAAARRRAVQVCPVLVRAVLAAVLAALRLAAGRVGRPDDPAVRGRALHRQVRAVAGRAGAAGSVVWRV